MNTLLEDKILNSFKTHPWLLNDKDIHEIKSIFNILNQIKKQEMLDRFENILNWIAKVKLELVQTQKMFFDEAITNIENTLFERQIAMIKNK